jgi:hypothetical protein
MCVCSGLSCRYDSCCSLRCTVRCTSGLLDGDFARWIRLRPTVCISFTVCLLPPLVNSHVICVLTVSVICDASCDKIIPGMLYIHDIWSCARNTLFCRIRIRREPRRGSRGDVLYTQYNINSTAVSEAKPPPGSRNGLKCPWGLLGSSRYNRFSRRRRLALAWFVNMPHSKVDAVTGNKKGSLLNYGLW